MKILINKCFGGFGLSRTALHELRKRGHTGALAEVDIGESWGDGGEVREEYLDSFLSNCSRTDPEIISVVKSLGKAASAPLAKVVIITIPDNIEYEIDCYDGIETIHEAHRSWS